MKNDDVATEIAVHAIPLDKWADVSGRDVMHETVGSFKTMTWAGRSHGMLHSAHTDLTFWAANTADGFLYGAAKSQRTATRRAAAAIRKAFKKSQVIDKPCDSFFVAPSGASK